MKKFIAILLVVLMLITSTSCGDSSLKGASQGVTKSSIKIANSIPISGAYASVGGPFKLGMEAYFKMINDNGGIGGKSIEFIHKDDEFKAENGKAFLEDFMYNEKVFAIVGHFGTSTVGATLDNIKSYGIPTVCPATGIGSLYNENAVDGNGRNIFPVQPIYNMEGRIMVSYAKGYFKAKKVGVIYTTDDAGKDLLAGIKQEADNLGIELVTTEIKAGATDATSQVAKMDDCDMVIAACIQATFPTIIKEMEKQDIMIPVITTYVNVSVTITVNNADYIQKLMHTRDAGIYGVGWLDVSANDEMVTWLEYMAAVGANTIDMNSYAMTGWIAASFFCEGLIRLENSDKAITWDNYIAAMEESPVKNPFGGYIDYTNGQRLGTQEMNLSRMDDTVVAGWIEVQPIQPMEAILAA